MSKAEPIKIYKWKDIRRLFTENLLIGNGASIAVCEKFDYKTLYGVAVNNHLISKNCEKLFRTFGSTNFEFIMKVLSDASKVNELLTIKEDKTKAAYDEIRKALIDSVGAIHPQRNEFEWALKSATVFMANFETIFSLNYDLLLYWAMLLYNSNVGANHFKDCFIPDGDDPNTLRFASDFEQFLRKPDDGLQASTLVFYPHGNLILANTQLGKEVKLFKDENCILDTILEKWTVGKFSPLIVSEGDSKKKVLAIESSNYLTNVYNGALAEMSGTLVIYGWSFSKQFDNHIFRALDRAAPQSSEFTESKLATIAISAYLKDPKYEKFCINVQNRIKASRNLRNCEIMWFDAESEGCWTH